MTAPDTARIDIAGDLPVPDASVPCDRPNVSPRDRYPLFTGDQERRLRQIAREEAIAVVMAAAHIQGEQAANDIRCRLRVSASELEEELSARAGDPL